MSSRTSLRSVYRPTVLVGSKDLGYDVLAVVVAEAIGYRLHTHLETPNVVLSETASGAVLRRRQRV